MVALCACHASLDLPQEQPLDGGTTGDAPVDAAMLGPWSAAAPIGVAATGLAEDDGTLSSTALELVFAVSEAGGKELYYTSRPSLTGAWAAPAKLGFNVADVSDETPRFSADDLTLYFASGRAGGPGNLDIYQVTRPQVGGAWGTPSLVDGPNTAALEKWLAPCDGGRYLVIAGNDIAEGTLGGAAPTVVATLSDPMASETGTFLTQDCLTAYFSSVRAGTRSILTSSRTSVGAAWSAPAIVSHFAALGGNQEDPWLAPDGRTFLLASDVSGTKDLYLSTR